MPSLKSVILRERSESKACPERSRSGPAFRKADQARKRVSEISRLRPGKALTSTHRIVRQREPYGNSRTQIFLKLRGSLLSPCACSLMGAASYFL